MKRINKLNSFTKYSKFNFSDKVKIENDLKAQVKDNTFYSWSAQSKVNPWPVSKAKGCYFWDFQDNKYFDLNSGLMSVNVGYDHPKILQRLREQIDTLTFAGPLMVTDIRARASEKLITWLPGDLKKVFFTLGGAEANENAIKFAKQFTKRTKIMSRYRSYHGATQGAMSISGDYRRWPNEPSMPGCIKTFDTYTYRCPFYRPGMTEEEYGEKLIEILELQLIFENPTSFAAIIVEPVVGSNGILIPPKNYMPLLRKLCDKYGILLICDEVMSGFGRTGSKFAVNHWDVVPDILTSAKGLTGSHAPLGMCAVRPHIAQHFEDTPLSAGLTYHCHPIGMAACLGSLEAMEEENVVENSKNMGKYMKSIMDKLADKHPCVGEVRQIGLFSCFELVKDRKTKEPLATFPGTSEAMAAITGHLRKNKVFSFAFINNLMCNPPLIVKKDELDEVFKHVDTALSEGDKFYTGKI